MPDLSKHEKGHMNIYVLLIDQLEIYIGSNLVFNAKQHGQNTQADLSLGRTSSK